MSRVERYLERLVERPSARLFRTKLQPIQVLRRIERAMESERGAEGNRGLVPDQFVVHIHPEDLAALATPEQVAAELASGALTFARSHGYALRDRPRVTLQPDARLRPGEVEVDAFVSPAREPSPGGARTPPVDAGTRVFEVPVVRAPDVSIEVREPNQDPRQIQANGAPMHIGRSPECELVLRDSRVSRRHARLTARDGVLVLTDLGSTNGTRVNGHRVTEVALGAGDRITIGETVLTIESATAGIGARA
jgi:hypothetical protein